MVLWLFPWSKDYKKSKPFPLDMYWIVTQKNVMWQNLGNWHVMSYHSDSWFLIQFARGYLCELFMLWVCFIPKSDLIPSFQCNLARNQPPLIFVLSRSLISHFSYASLFSLNWVCFDFLGYIKGNAQILLLCNPQKSSINIYLKILKSTVTKKSNCVFS